MNQRWNHRRDSYRPNGEPIRTTEYDVVEIKHDRVAKDFVVQHHYSASYPAARFRFGLYHGDRLEGVAVFSHPCQDKVLTNVFPGVETKAATELGRLVLLDEVPANGESFFVAEAFRQLRTKGVAGVLSFSDPVPRRTAEGVLVMPGHTGCVYQALNARYLGRGTPRTLRILPDGTVFSDRAASKIRNLERGWEYSADLLVKHGAEPIGDSDPAQWLSCWLKRLTRSLRHRGNHKYIWGIDKALRRTLPVSLPYPKQIDQEAA